MNPEADCIHQQPKYSTGNPTPATAPGHTDPEQMKSGLDKDRPDPVRETSKNILATKKCSAKAACMPG